MLINVSELNICPAFYNANDAIYLLQILKNQYTVAMCKQIETAATCCEIPTTRSNEVKNHP